MSDTSTKPYLLRALYEWCTDNGYTPHIAVYVDHRTHVPQAFVNNDEIILNISARAAHQLLIDNEWIDFHGRFAGRSHKIQVPITNVLAIYALENGQGMAFPVEKESLANEPPREKETTELETQEELPETSSSEDEQKEKQNKTTDKGRRGHLTLIK